MAVRPRRAAIPVRWWPNWLPAGTIAVFALAFVARLVPVLRGGGLFGIDTYDDSVHYSAALALVHGVLPYRDFLFLHPPGVVVALSPFAAFGAATHDGWGFAAGRIAWMLMGSATAALIVVALRGVGPLGALVGGIGYSIYLPAIRAERTTMLEGLTSALLVVALLLIGTAALRVRHPWLVYVGSGALLGAAAGVKIWGVVVVVVVLAWAALARGVDHAVRLGLGAIVGVVAVCLPFFLAAPAAMWRMVVVDQVARPDSPLTLITRLGEIVGMPEVPIPDPGVAVAGTVAIVGLILIRLCRPGRLAPLLLLAMGAVVLLSPSFYAHYPAALAVPLAMTVGSATPIIQGWATALGRLAPSAVGAVTVAALVALAAPVSQAEYGARIPTAALTAALDGQRGCVTADDPTILVELDVFSRNIARHCPVVIDLTGYSYDLEPREDISRIRDVAFQQFAVDYLSSGRVSLTWRLWTSWGYSSRTRAELRRWPVLVGVGTYVVRLPQPGLDRGK